jgi:hypothetical protein
VTHESNHSSDVLPSLHIQYKNRAGQIRCRARSSAAYSHLAFFSKPHRRFKVSATAVCFVGGCLQAGADSQEAARPLRPGTLAMVESSGTSGASSQPVSTVTLLTAVPETTHLLELLWRLAWMTDIAVWLPAEVKAVCTRQDMWVVCKNLCDSFMSDSN